MSSTVIFSDSDHQVGIYQQILLAGSQGVFSSRILEFIFTDTQASSQYLGMHLIIV